MPAADLVQMHSLWYRCNLGLLLLLLLRLLFSLDLNSCCCWHCCRW
jgi:hypothetical protein